VLFFVLSGFLIGKLDLERPFKAAEVWTYLVARFARIYPLFAFVVIGVGLINYTVPDASLAAATATTARSALRT
jgi:peptidoglycan/LPS O-acetylase OafA/YrhL